MQLLDQTVTRLRAEFVAAGKESQFEGIKIFLTGEKRAAAYAELATKLVTNGRSFLAALRAMARSMRFALRTSSSSA